MQPSQYTLFSGTAPRTPPPGVFDVAGIPGDDVDVEVHHRLAGVDADVEAVGVEPTVEEGGEFRDVPEGEFPSGQ